MKKSFRTVLAVAIVVSMMLSPAVSVSAEEYEGQAAEAVQEYEAESAEAYEGEPPLEEETEETAATAAEQEAKSVSLKAVRSTAGAEKESGRESVAKMTMDQVRDLYDAVSFYQDLYEKEPVVAGENYSPAVLSGDAKAAVLDWINYYRTAASLGAVTLSEEANTLASYGALCLAMNNSGLSHTPPQPADMSDSDYQTAYATTQSSNLSARFGYAENMILSGAISGQIGDTGGNMSTLGHRRWLLDPRMLTTGVGAADNGGWYYVDVKVFDAGVSEDSTISDYDYIAWPASGKNLTETFPVNTPWSVTLNTRRYAAPSISDVNVSLKRLNDGKSWEFNADTGTTDSADAPYFNVDNAGYGISNCIIFRPPYSDISRQIGIYEVTVSGIQDRSGNDTSITYTVEFAPFESDLNNYTVSLEDIWNYTGDSICPEVSVMAASTKLIEGTDYTVTYSDNIGPGTGHVTVSGIGNYSGTVEKTFTISRDEFVTFDANGGSGAPDYVMIENGKALIPNQIPIADRKNFIGWSEDPQANQAQYQPGDTLESETGITLYAVWADPYVITEGELQTADLSVPGSSVWFLFTPEYSCNYTLDINESCKLKMYKGSSTITYSAGDCGMSDTNLFDKDTDVYVNIWFEDTEQTGIVTFSFTLQHSPVTVIEAKDPSCTEDGCTAERSCSVCGEVFEHSTVIPAKGHTAEEDPAVAATCTTPGKTAGSHCSVCGEIITAQEEIPALGHQFGAWTSAGLEKHKHTCSRCGAEESEAHSWGEPVITREATEDEEGIRAYTCTVCGQTKTETIPKTDHVHNYKESVVNPTCTEQGYLLHKCEKCGDEYRDSFTAALGHTFREWTTVTEPTCAGAGSRERSCTRCGKKETESIPATGHTEVADPAVEATCTAAGKTVGSHCSVCGQVIKAQETIPAKGHQFGAWTSTGDTNHKHSCSVCGAEETKVHTWGTPVITKEPTADEEGMRTYTCTACDQTKTESIPVLVTKEWIRLAGNGRYDTMAEIVKEGFNQTGGTVVVATGTGFKDALAAAGLAGLHDAPVILTDGKVLSAKAQEQLKRLKPTKVFIAGGEAAVSKTVFNNIQKVTGIKPTRCYGQTSAGTSAALATAGSGWSDTAIIATSKTFKDALSAAPISYSLHMPILLADNGKSLNNDVLKALKTCEIKNVIIVGGKLAVTENVENQLIRNGIAKGNIHRIAGNTAVDTSADIATYGLNHGLTINGMGVATSQNYPDALAGAALCGHNNSVLVLADDKAMKNTSFPKDYKADFSKGYVFGGTLAVSDKVVKALEAAVK